MAWGVCARGKSLVLDVNKSYELDEARGDRGWRGDLPAVLVFRLADVHRGYHACGDQV